MKRNPKEKLILALAFAVTLVLLVGFAAHSDHGLNLCFGRYTPAYLLFLAALAFPLPFLPFFVSFLLRPSERVLSGGRLVIFSPRKKICFLALLVFALVAMAESYLQVAKALRPPDRPPDYLLQFHPFLQIVPTPLTYEGINRHGFRGPEIEVTKRPGTFRVFCLGGSTTFNPFLAYEDTYPRQLERFLRERYPGTDLELQNAGMGWYTSQHSVINYLIRVQDFQPDLLIFMHGINDLFRSFSPPRYAIAGFGYRSDYSHFLGPQADMFMDLSEQREPTVFDAIVLLRKGTEFFVQNFMSDWRFQQEDLEDWDDPELPSLAAFERNLDTLCDAAAARGTKLMLLTQPSLYRDDLSGEELAAIKLPQELATDGFRKATIRSMRIGMERFNEITRRFAKERGIPLVDLAPAIPKTLEFFADDVHYTPKGSRRVAELVAGKIIEFGEW